MKKVADDDRVAIRLDKVQVDLSGGSVKKVADEKLIGGRLKHIRMAVETWIANNFYVEAIEFKEQNTTIAKDDVRYETLHAHYDTLYGAVTTCWEFPLVARLMVLFTGKVWVCNQTFGKRFHPTLLSTNKEHFIKHGSSVLQQGER